LHDGEWEAVRMLEPGQKGDSIVVVSDGSDYGSKVSIDRVQDAVLSNGTRVFFAIFVDRYLPTQEQRTGAIDAAKLSEDSGGLSSLMENPEAALKAAREIAFAIQNYFVLRFTLARAVEKKASLHLEAVDSSGRKRKDVELLFPHKVLPCASLRSSE
jgi:hypothetical protein